MEISFFLIASALVIIVCTIMGAKNGLLSMLYGLLAWIFVLWFAFYTKPFFSEFLYNRTTIAEKISISIEEDLNNKYNSDRIEINDEDNIFDMFPESIREKMDMMVTNTVQAFVKALTVELTDLAVEGIATVLSFVISVLITLAGAKLVNIIGKSSLLEGPNLVLGSLIGFFQGLIIIWVIMYIAICFATTSFGIYIIEASTSDRFLSLLYNNNLVLAILK